MKLIFYIFLCFLSLSIVFSQDADPLNIEQLEALLPKHSQQMDSLMETRGISYASRKIRLDEIIDALDFYSDNVAFLIYDFDNENLFSWLIDNNGVQLFTELPITQDELLDVINGQRLSMNINHYQLNRLPHKRGIVIKHNDNLEKASQSVETTTRRLSSILFPQPLNKELMHYSHCLILPVKAIGAVPFSMLYLDSSDKIFIDYLSYSILPNIEDLIVKIEESKILFNTSNSMDIKLSFSFENPLIVGNPLFPENTDWIFPVLPGSEKEVTFIAEFLQTEAIIAEKATKSKIIVEMKSADFIYFATHGISDSFDPLDKSFLVFSGETASDSFLTASEIQQTELGADIAVLSACQTGLGKVHDAGIIGLTRAFHIAGVRLVIMSLWSIDDNATAYLMQEFIRQTQIPTKHFPQEALRKAILTCKHKYEDPIYWASFSCFGIPFN
jgi:CHAT domain-containing protein